MSHRLRTQGFRGGPLDLLTPQTSQASEDLQIPFSKTADQLEHNHFRYIIYQISKFARPFKQVCVKRALKKKKSSFILFGSFPVHPPLKSLHTHSFHILMKIAFLN